LRSITVSGYGVTPDSDGTLSASIDTFTYAPVISARLPEGWFAKESITLLHPDGQANVIASSEPLSPEMDTRQYADEQGKLLRGEFFGYREHAFEEARIFGRRTGFIRRFQWDPPDGVTVMQVQLYYAEASRGFTATATTPLVHFPRYEEELRAVLDGLVIDGEKLAVGRPQTLLQPTATGT
jgi:hypothetical protein